MNAEDFWKRVTQSPKCWIWNGGTNKMGYGFYGRRKAHRMAWEFTYGEIPKGQCVCHTCDVRNCVNPSHLFLGTTAENNYDMLAKGRGVNPKGEAHGMSRLSVLEVCEIKALAKPGNYSSLARDFGVSVQQISRIANGQQWRCLAKEGKS